MSSLIWLILLVCAAAFFQKRGYRRGYADALNDAGKLWPQA